MIEIACRLYEPGRASAHDVTVRFYADGTVERAAPFDHVTRVAKLEISDRVGNAARRIVFDDGATCETVDNDALDRALARAGRGGGGARLHRLESRWRWALLALAVTVISVYLLVDRGIPAAARLAAAGLPAAVHADLGRRTMGLLDRSVFERTGLPAATRSRLRRRLRATAGAAGLGLDFELEFRAAPRLGANALAVPGGTIVVTDALVGLAQSDEEVLAVLAHELGHLRHRHGVRTVLQNSGIAVLVIAATGDVSWLATTLPSALVSARYSRAFEREADRFAVRYLRRAGIAPAHLGRMLGRLRARYGDGGGFLSSHPATRERIEALSAGS